MLKTRWRGRVWVCIRRFLSYSPLCNSATSHYSPSLLFIICNNNKIIKIINKNKKIKRQKSPFTCLIISYLRFAIGTDLGHKQRNLKFSAPTTQDLGTLIPSATYITRELHMLTLFQHGKQIRQRFCEQALICRSNSCPL